MGGEPVNFLHRSAVKLLLPFLAGILLGWNFGISIRLSLVVVLLSISGLLWCGLRPSSGRAFSYAATIFLFALGVVKITLDMYWIPADSVARCVSAERTAIVRGTISDLPSVSSQSVRFGIDAQVVIRDSVTEQVTGNLAVSLLRRTCDSTLIDSLTYGRTVILRGALVSLPVKRNPGEFDLANYLELNGIVAQLKAGRLGRGNLGDAARANFLADYVFPVRKSISRRIDEYVGGEEAKFLKGLIVGERSDIAMEVKTAFINSGVMHIIAVSGLHVAIVLMMLLFFLQFLRVPEIPKLLSISAFLVYYIFLTGGTPSVSRAVIMAIVFLSAKLFERRTDMYNALALSALILLLIDAKQLFQAGFQLSYMAVFSLVYFSPRLLSLQRFFPHSLLKHSAARWTFAGLSVSFAAGIGTLPFTAFYFGKISLIGFLANLVIVPLSNIVLALGMLMVGVSYLSSWLAGIYGEATRLSTHLLLAGVGFFGALPYSFLPVSFSTAGACGFYALLIFLLNSKFRSPGMKLIILALCIGNVIVFRAILSDEKKVLRVTFLDVGQGDGIVVECPGGEAVLVDAGMQTPHFDTGQRTVLPFLRYKKIGSLYAVINSHPHSDHLGGIPFILRSIPAAAVIDAGSNGRSSLFSDYLHLLDSIKIDHRIERFGNSLLDIPSIRCYVLHPSGQFLQEIIDSTRRVNLNNESLVLKICYGKTSLLLSGDAEREAEGVMSRQYRSFLKSDVLKVGHHGSKTSSSDIYLHYVQPQFAIISVGEKNKFKHPPPATVGRLQNMGASVLRTDRLGAVVMESDGERWSVVDWRK